MKYWARKLNNTLDPIVFEAANHSDAFTHAEQTFHISGDEIEVMPLLVAPVEVEAIQMRLPGTSADDVAYFISDGAPENASDYLRLFNGAPRMLELLMKISEDVIKTPNVQESQRLVNLILGASESGHPAA